MRRLAPARAHAAVLTLALVAFVAAISIGRSIFPYGSSNNDEAVYRLQAQILGRGHLTLPADRFDGGFEPWMSADRDGRLVLVFQPAFPALLALAEKATGSDRVALGFVAVAAMVAVYALAGEVGLKRSVQLTATALFALSPLALVQSALFLEYLFATALEAGALALVLRAVRLERWSLFGPAGLFFGILLIARPLEAALVGLATLVYIGATLRKASAVRRAVAWIALGAAAPAALMFAYNAALTGHPLRFPIWAIGGNNAFGFGKRNIVAGSPLIDVSVLNALKATHQNLRSLPHWMFGSLLIIPLALWGLWIRRRDAWARLLAAVGVLIPLGYFFYWGNLLIVNGRKQIGPHYYLALMIPAAIFGAIGLEQCYVRLRSRLPTGTAIALIVATLTLATAIELPDKIDRNLHFTRSYRAEQRSLDAAITRPSIVILPVTPDGPYVLHPRGWLANDLDLAGRTLYAADRGPANAELADRFPDRDLLRLQAVEKSPSPLTFRPSVRRVQITEAAQVRRISVAPPAPGSRVRAYVQTSPSDRLTCDLGSLASFTFEIAPGLVASSACPNLRLAPTDSRYTAVAGIEIYRDSGTPIELREVRIPIDTTKGRIRAVDAETWRIVPRDKVPARVIENHPDFLLEPV